MEDADTCSFLARGKSDGHTRRVDEDFVQQSAAENAELSRVVDELAKGE